MALHQILQKMQLFICNMLYYMVNHTQTEISTQRSAKYFDKLQSEYFYCYVFQKEKRA